MLSIKIKAGAAGARIGKARTNKDQQWTRCEKISKENAVEAVEAQT